MAKLWGKKQIALVGLAALALAAVGALYSALYTPPAPGHGRAELLLLCESTLHAAINSSTATCPSSSWPRTPRYRPSCAARQRLHTAEPVPSEALNNKAGPSSQYIMSGDGITVATSNFRATVSYMGHDFSFRSYFREAMQGGRGIFYGIWQAARNWSTIR